MGLSFISHIDGNTTESQKVKILTVWLVPNFDAQRFVDFFEGHLSSFGAYDSPTFLDINFNSGYYATRYPLLGTKRNVLIKNASGEHTNYQLLASV